jgi:hypothetical protein
MFRFKQESSGRISKKLTMHNLNNFALAIIIDKNGVKRGMIPRYYWINVLIFCGNTPDSRVFQPLLMAKNQ